IPVIIEESVNYSTLEPFVIESLLQKKPIDRITETIIAVDVFGSKSLIDPLVGLSLSPDFDGVQTLEQLFAKGKSSRLILGAIRALAMTWIDEWLTELGSGDWTHFSSILKTRSILEWTDEQTLASISDRMPVFDSATLPTFGRFVENGFKETLVLRKFNVVPMLVHAVLHYRDSRKTSEEALTGTLRIQSVFRTLRETFADLNGQLKLTDPEKYVSPDSLEKSAIRSTFQRYQKALKDTEGYKPFDPKGFEAFQPYQKIYGFVMDNFAQEDKAMQIHPEKITMEAIQSMLQSGQYFSAIVALTRKAEFILKKMIPEGRMLEDLIDSAFSKGFISKIEKNDLHTFRRARNKTFHYDPLDPGPDFDKNDLTNWSVLVFGLNTNLSKQK
ncbi:MAG TPA: hypothetical protein PLZ76_07780, partial [Bacillota bacterium]|nr:hypothetical protein [Bacillota bacterium]